MHKCYPLIHKIIHNNDSTSYLVRQSFFTLLYQIFYNKKLNTNNPTSPGIPSNPAIPAVKKLTPIFSPKT